MECYRSFGNKWVCLEVALGVDWLGGLRVGTGYGRGREVRVRVM